MTDTPQSNPHWASRILLILFLLSLPMINPWVRGDGVGYYALARAPLIQHNFDFLRDYQEADASFRQNRLDPNGQPYPDFRTSTGHLDNHFTVGPAMLWSPFLLAAHGAVLFAHALGSKVLGDGFSAPYRVAMALGTAIYGFLGLWISFRIARKYVEERWALLATIGIWWASSLPIYMYFNPAWSHAHSAFVVALFVWYWLTTRDSRTLAQWILLGVITGLMLDVYYPNVMICIILIPEALRNYSSAIHAAEANEHRIGQLFARHLVFLATAIVCLLPTFVTRKIIYGSPFKSGYYSVREWHWLSPDFLAVLFSSDHGLFSWTPILLFSVLGIFAFWRSVPRVGLAFLAATLAFYYFISSYPDWDGISAFGNRFFVSLTPLFVVGLAVFLDRVMRVFSKPRTANLIASVFLACFAIWNIGLMFQWGVHLIPARGPISFPEMVHNQFTVVPAQFAADFRSYLFRRNSMMQKIQERDLQQLKTDTPQ